MHHRDNSACCNSHHKSCVYFCTGTRYTRKAQPLLHSLHTTTPVFAREINYRHVLTTEIKFKKKSGASRHQLAQTEHNEMAASMHAGHPYSSCCASILLYCTCIYIVSLNYNDIARALSVHHAGNTMHCMLTGYTN